VALWVNLPTTPWPFYFEASTWPSIHQFGKPLLRRVKILCSRSVTLIQAFDACFGCWASQGQGLLLVGVVSPDLTHIQARFMEVDSLREMIEIDKLCGPLLCLNIGRSVSTLDVNLPGSSWLSNYQRLLPRTPWWRF
jgi:hypothetical protein